MDGMQECMLLLVQQQPPQGDLTLSGHCGPEIESEQGGGQMVGSLKQGAKSKIKDDLELNLSLER